MAEKKKGLQYFFLLLLFYVICLYLSFSAFFLVGSDGKVARIKMISNTKLHVYKTLALSLKASSLL